jgi:glycosyltransferase involved in cell wall biosynthesis
MIRVLLGASALRSPLTGVGQYAFHLASGLLRNPDVELTCFYGRTFSKDVLRSGSVANARLRARIREQVPHAYAMRRLLHQAVFSVGTARQQYDVYHEPSYLGLRFKGPSVLTVHDLSWIRYPETHPRERVDTMNRFFEPALRRAAIVLTDSEFVRQEVIDTFGMATERVLPVPLGADSEFHPMSPLDTQDILGELKLTYGEYFLCVGTLEPRKNLEAAIRAYSLLPQAVRARHPLVLAGLKGWHTSRIERTLDPLVRNGEAVVLGYLERAELAAVTAAALTLVYPSLYEGFGLPPLEAMACGVPPIISTAGSLVEVVGDAGLQVEAHDVDGLAASMARMAEDRVLRNHLGQVGLQRSADFTWERCVNQTVGAYRQAATMQA